MRIDRGTLQYILKIKYTKQPEKTNKNKDVPKSDLRNGLWHQNAGLIDQEVGKINPFHYLEMYTIRIECSLKILKKL